MILFLNMVNECQILLKQNKIFGLVIFMIDMTAMRTHCHSFYLSNLYFLF